MDNEQKDDNYRRKTNRFMALGGTAAIFGLFATAPDLATSPLAQQVGLYSAIIAAVGIVGAGWNFASRLDLQSGKTLASEFKDVKNDFGNILGRIRKEFDDEFSRNQGLDDKGALDEALKSKTRVMKR